MDLTLFVQHAHLDSAYLRVLASGTFLETGPSPFQLIGMNQLEDGFADQVGGGIAEDRTGRFVDGRELALRRPSCRRRRVHCQRSTISGFVHPCVLHTKRFEDVRLNALQVGIRLVDLVDLLLQLLQLLDELLLLQPVADDTL